MNTELRPNCTFKYLLGSMSEKELNEFKKAKAFGVDQEIKIDDIKNEDMTNIKVVIVISVGNKDEIGQAVAVLKEKKAEYCYYLFFMKTYKISAMILSALADTDFVDASENTVKYELSSANFWIEVYNGSKNQIILGKGIVGTDLHILCTGKEAKIDIGRFISFNNCIIEAGNNSAIKIGDYCRFDDRCEILCGNDNYYLIDGQNNLIEPIESHITINEHVKIGKCTKIIKGADIGSGSVIASWSVVDSAIPPCSYAAGNRAVIKRSNISWAFGSGRNDDNPGSLYEIKDKIALKYFTNKKTIFIHGSCVSRTIVDNCIDVSVKYHLLQNPIHTMFFKGIKINPSKIKVENDSRFMRKTLMTEFSKNQLNCIKDNIADFYIMDLADIRFSYFELVKDPGIRMYGHFDIYNTLDELRKNNKEMDFIKKSFDTIPVEEWKSYIDKYIDYILRFYPKNRIIFIKVPIAKEYMKDGKMTAFDNNLLEISVEPLLRELEEYTINTKLSGADIIEIPPNVIGDGDHSLGMLPLHYTKDVYLKMARKIDEYVNNEGVY